MNRALLYKELSQHWMWLVLNFLLTMGIVGLASYSANATGTGAGAISGVGFGLLWVLPITTGVLGNLLITREFQVATQMFIDGLPLPRWRMITLKICLAVSISLLMAVACVFLGWVMALGSEVVSSRFLWIVLASACSWAAFICMVMFVVSYLGRYRSAIVMSVAISLLLYNVKGSVPLVDFSPFALMSSRRFGLERQYFPINHLILTNAYTLGLIVVAYIMGLVREGSVASMLGEKMSYREKMLIGGILVIFLITISAIYDQPEPTSFDLPGAVVEKWDGVSVYVSPEVPGDIVDLEIGIASRLARRLAKQRDWLRIPKEQFPNVYVVEKTDIEDEERIEWEFVADKDAVLMYAGLRQPAFSEDRLLAWSMSNVMSKITYDRIGHEDRWWIMCGLEGLWELEKAPQKLRNDRIQMAVAAIEKQPGFSIQNLIDWHKFQDDVEWRSADAVAWMGFQLLVEKKGLEVVRQLAVQTVTRPCKRADFRAVWWDYTNPVGSTFKGVTGLSLSDFTEEWRIYILSHGRGEEDRSKVND